MAEFKNEKFNISFDAETGFVTSLVSANDKNKMNWAISDAAWGKVSGFRTQKVEIGNEGAIIEAVGTEDDSKGLSLRIERKLTKNGYEERYIFKNESKTDFFITQETFGIYFSFYSLYYAKVPAEEQIPKNCVAHVWCGDASCWICAKKADGSPEKLFIRMTEGNISDYSIDRDISKAHGSDHRGDIALNPTPTIIDEGAQKVYAFTYSFSEAPLEEILSGEEDFIYAYADTYTGFLGETISAAAEYKNGIDSARVLINGEEIAYVKADGKILWEVQGNTLGEKKIDIYINDKHTYIVLNFIEPIATILEKRAYFIAQKHQYHKPGSRLDGAYLIYDDALKRQYYSDSFLDNNAGRERIAMGIIVLRQLQKKKDDFLMQSIEKHLEFIEREHFDAETGITYNHLDKNNAWNRAFNYPWFSIYFKEWYLLTKDTKHLKSAALSLLNYYDVTNFQYDGQMAEPYDLVMLLEKENMLDLAEKIREKLLETADFYVNADSASCAGECSYIQECPNDRAVYASQAYLFSKDEKHLAEAKRQKTLSEVFSACQPDYHMNRITVRFWDRFWFGKKRQYGDVYPQDWSALMAWMYGWYEKASGEDCKKFREEILKNNMCLYRPDGFARNNYLYPYKVTNYAKNPNHNDPHRPTGSYYGKCYDEWSNDQDWALYLADYFMNREMLV